MTKQVGWTMALMLCATSTLGCSSKSPNNGGAAGAAGLATGFGTGGTVGGFAGTSTGAAGAAGSAAMSVPCGSMTCAPAIAIPGLGGGQVCCANSGTGTCGLMSGATCMPRPTPNPNCASVVVLGTTVNGCCMADGTTCGIDGYPLTAGCTSASTLAMLGLTVAAKHCDGTPITGTAGMSGTAGAAGGAGGAGGAAGHSGAGGAGGAGGSAGHSGAGGAGGAAGH